MIRCVPRPDTEALQEPCQHGGMVDRRLLLEEERERTRRLLVSLTDDYAEVVAASRDTNADDEHDPEGSTIAFERSQVSALVLQTQAHLREVDAAAERLADGSYGRCETCGQPIGDDRLRARPVARTCIVCASR